MHRETTKHKSADTFTLKATRDTHSDRESASESGSKMPVTAPKSSVDKPAGNEDGFTRFYNNLATGPLSKLSSMLAFTGLPLTEDNSEDSPGEVKTESTSERANGGPDVKKMFSSAALRAIEDQQRSQGFSGNTFGPGESFYVIPTSGGTASYANIVSKAQQDAQRNRHGDPSDEFVDAWENPVAQSPRLGSDSGAARQPYGAVREEELQLENASLKQILDKLSHRLQAFESHAQDASMAALTQSMASIRTQPSSVTAEMEERMRAMEVQLEREMREREQLGLENQKQKQIITKYRSHWEQLKDSARAKERAKREQSGQT